jgi:hypothetical protein
MKESKNMYGFTVESFKHKFAGFPLEDYFAWEYSEESDLSVACVADGITRDFIDNTVAKKNLASFIKSRTGQYSPHAQNVSRIGVNTFLKTRSLESSNLEINHYNKERGLIPTDYWGRDLAGCTAAGISIDYNRLSYESICDSGIAVFDEKGNLKFKTSNEGPNSKGDMDKEVKDKFGVTFDQQEGRRIIRSQYRNNPSQPLSYGALTGEEAALSYIRRGTENIQDKDFVLLYTDGVGDIIFQGEKTNPDFTTLLLSKDRKKIMNFCRREVYSEGTLVVYERPDYVALARSEREHERYKMRAIEDIMGPLGPEGRYLGR